MKKAVAILISLFSLTVLSVSQESRRVPQGIREADKAAIASERNTPPPERTAPRNHQHLAQDADELARLAGSIPADIEKVHRGLLPADLKEKLKQIETRSSFVTDWHLERSLSARARRPRDRMTGEYPSVWRRLIA